MSSDFTPIIHSDRVIMNSYPATHTASPGVQLSNIDGKPRSAPCVLEFRPVPMGEISGRVTALAEAVRQLAAVSDLEFRKMCTWLRSFHYECAAPMISDRTWVARSAECQLVLSSSSTRSGTIDESILAHARMLVTLSSRSMPWPKPSGARFAQNWPSGRASNVDRMLSVRMNDSVLAQLRELAELRGTTVSALTRELVEYAVSIPVEEDGLVTLAEDLNEGVRR